MVIKRTVLALCTILVCGLAIATITLAPSVAIAGGDGGGPGSPAPDSGGGDGGGPGGQEGD